MRSRRQFRHIVTGQTGDLLESGKLEIRRGAAEPYTVPLDENWLEVDATRKFARAHVAAVAHAGDQALCRAAGFYEEEVKSWHELTSEQKAVFSEQGPGMAEPIRMRLFDAIMAVIEPITVKT
jgi:hypothetical protein